MLAYAIQSTAVQLATIIIPQKQALFKFLVSSNIKRNTIQPNKNNVSPQKFLPHL